LAAAEGLRQESQERVKVVEIHRGGQTERLLLEFAAVPVSLLVLGAGHLSREIVPLAKRVHFRVAVADDRPMFANQEAFPSADEVLLGEFDDVFDRFTVDRGTFVLIVTRGHLHDEMLLEKALATEAAYIGMIGSKVKIRTIYGRLRKRGVTEERLAFVHAPVGVSIGARLPEEIAVSIVAELIAVRNGERT
jgi:xanthine dehydrogenase accessory factor